MDPTVVRSRVCVRRLCLRSGCVCLARWILFSLALSLYLLLSLALTLCPSHAFCPLSPHTEWLSAFRSSALAWRCCEHADPKRGASLRAVRCTRQITLPASCVARFHLKGLDKASTLNLIPARLGRSIRVTLDVFFNQKMGVSWKMSSQVRAELQATIEWPASTSKASHADGARGCVACTSMIS